MICPRLHRLKSQIINHPKGTHEHAHVDRSQPFTHLLPSVPIRFVITERWFLFPLFALEIRIFCVCFSYKKTFWVEPSDEKMKEERKITKNSLNGPMIIICIICSHSMFRESSWSLSWPQFVYLKWTEAVRLTREALRCWQSLMPLKWLLTEGHWKHCWWSLVITDGH